MSELRDYQKVAIYQLRQSYKSGKKRVLLVSPTGSGKTRMAVEVVTGAIKKGHRVLWVTHRRELLYQSVERLKREGVPEPGIILANEPQTAPGAPVQVASVDTLRARSLRPEANFVIWDEAHHIAADTWTDLQALYPDAYHLGLTATPERGDGRPLGEFFDDLVVGATVPELQALGYLVPCVVEAPSKKLESHKMAQDPLSAWQEKAAGLQTILYASTVEEAYRYAKEFQAAGIKAEALESQTPLEQRQAILRRFEQGRLTILCNVAILTEGWDCPPASVCLVARTVGTVGLWLQMVGRVLRPTEQKDYALILDLVGNVYEHGPPDLDREFSRQFGIVTPFSYRLSESRCRTCGAFSMKRPCPSCGYLPVRRDKEITGEALQPYQQKTNSYRSDTSNPRAAFFRQQALLKQDQEDKERRAERERYERLDAQKQWTVKLRAPCPRCGKTKGIAKKKGPQYPVFCATPHCQTYSHNASDSELLQSKSVKARE